MVSMEFHSRECTEKCQPVKISLIVRHFKHSLYIKIYMHFCIHIEPKYTIFMRKKCFGQKLWRRKEHTFDLKCFFHINLMVFEIINPTIRNTFTGNSTHI
jgi:hypothetical protein